MKLKIGISPCPNDTYIFDAIYNKVIGIDGVEFEFTFADIQELNELALSGSLDIVKLSYAHFFQVMDQYELLRSGGALGQGVGPLLIYKEKPVNLNESTVAIPGEHTTANFLLSHHFPEIKQKQILRFDQIENAVLEGIVDLGLIIHENRFTYKNKGLHLLADLGDLWELKHKLPIPLGGIAIKRKISKSLKASVNELVVQSIQLSDRNNDLSNFIKGHAQEMEPEVMQSHIDLYVNSFSKDIGDGGIQAIEAMRKILSPQSSQNIFVEL